MKKFFVWILLLLTLTGCRSTDPADTPATQDAQEEETTAAATTAPETTSPDVYKRQAQTAKMIFAAACARKESVGAHYIVD